MALIEFWPLCQSFLRVDNSRHESHEEEAEFIVRRCPREVAEFKPSEESRRRVRELFQQEKTT